MRYAIRHIAGLALVLLAALVGAPGQAQPVLVLQDPTASLDVQAEGLAWVDANAEASIAQVAAGQFQAFMSPSRSNTIYKLGTHAVLWQHYRFQEPLGSQHQWVLEFPVPLLDKVTVYQQSADGQWLGQTAGDTVPVSSWPEPGRYAQFSLNLQPGVVLDVYVRIQHQTQINIPVNVISRVSQGQRRQVDYMLIGVVFGALLLLVIASAAQSWVYRDRLYGWYAGYAAIMMGVIATTSGMAGHLLWGDSATWNNAAQGFLGLVGGSIALLMVRSLCSSNAHHALLDQVSYWTALAGPVLALFFVVMDRTWGVRLIGVYLTLCVVLGLVTAFLASRRRDVVGLWVLGAFIPLSVATLAAVARIFGWLPSSWLIEHSLMVALAVEAPLLLVALNIRSRERHIIETREQAMSSQDALTGLLTPHLFSDRLSQVLSRAMRHKEPAAVVYVELVNYNYIKRTHGIAVAEQSLLRSVIKLRRILRDVDTAGRVDEARFGLILEGVSTREPVTELAARLIATGLMPLKGLKPEVLLQFHVAGVLLNERLMEGPALSQALSDLLAGMAERTRRPIRFLEPDVTRPSPLERNSRSGNSDRQSIAHSG
ncbi:MAG: 7TM diverse intracellular signaling domain-containing protein [Polaromonas sp.]|nr:7TM diverse intracellular signaling domain-containing protein [Polaromonas sp.]